VKVELILDVDDLHRRVPEIYFNEETGKISTAAFQNTTGTDDMSVDLGRLTTPQKTALNDPKFGVASFKAGFARKNDQKVFHDPIAENLAHSNVRGKKTSSFRKKLVAESILILRPTEKFL